MALRTLRLPSGIRLDNGGGSVVVNPDGTVTVTGVATLTSPTLAGTVGGTPTFSGVVTFSAAPVFNAFVDITAGGLRIAGTPSAAANTVIITGTSATSHVEFWFTARAGFIGFNAGTDTLAGVASASADLKLAIVDTLGGFFDSSDSRRLILGGGLRFGSAAGMLIAGATSGVVTITTNATAGTWTMELPAAVPGTTGDQLSATTAGVCSWTAAGSLREWKHILGVLDPQLALRRIVETPVELWRYRKDAKSSTGDFETVYTSVVADRAPWAMNFGGTKLSEISTSGHAFAAIQALWQENQELRRRVSVLEAA